ncbi:MAG: condensation domain-containing protein [Polyangiales bacterium]
MTSRSQTPVDFDPFSSGALQTVVPLSEPQRELWLSVEFGGRDANCAYNECVAVEVDGSIDEHALNKAIAAVVARHDALRGTVSSDGANLLISEEPRFGFRVVEFSDTRADESLSHFFEEEMGQPFDLVQGPLLRATLIRLPAKNVIVVTAHHIVCDGWSFGILMHEISVYYRHFALGATVELPEPASYERYAIAVSKRDLSHDESYWFQRLNPPPTPLDLPLDKARPKLRTYRSKRIDLVLDPNLSAQLRKLSSSLGVTFFALLKSTFDVLIHRWSQSSDFVVGVPVAGQMADNEPMLVGHAVNVLPTRAKPVSTQSFEEFANTTQDQLFEDFDHQNVSFGKLLASLALERAASRVPLVPITFNLDTKREPLSMGTASARDRSVPRDYDPFEIAANVVDNGDSIIVECNYNSDLFDAQTITDRLDGYRRMLQAICENPKSRLCDLPILSETEVRLIGNANDTFVAPSTFRTVVQLVDASARSHPDKIAITFGNSSLSYRDLSAISDRVAKRLLEKGVQRGDVIGVCVDRSLMLCPLLLGILKAGAAYLPLDPHQPEARLQHCVQNSGAKLAVVDASAPTTLGASATINLDRLVEPTSNLESSAVSVSLAPSDLCYVIYTSGSTGVPKGVEVTHAGLANILRAFAKRPGCNDADSWLAITTLSFDIAALELFLPLSVGATVHIAPSNIARDPFRLATMLRDNQITILQAVPTTWRLLIESGAAFPKSLRALCGGEALPSDLRDAILDRGIELWNVYGPTETTIWSSIARADHSDAVSIGRPIDNTEMQVLDEDTSTRPSRRSWAIVDRWNRSRSGLSEQSGTHRRAVCITRCARVDSAFTRYRRHPRNGHIPVNSFTSDETIIRLRFEGFESNSVRLNRSSERSDVEQSCVQAQELDGTNVLVAYVVARGKFDEQSARAALAEKLPDYMLPSYWMQVRNFELNANGKIDRNKLPLPTTEATESSASLALPNNDLEAMLIGLFQEHLGAMQIGVNDDFFEKGGHSLLALRLVQSVRQHTEASIELHDLFVAPTPRRLAAAIKERGGRSATPIVTLANGPRDKTIYCLVGIQVYSALADRLRGDFMVKAVLAPSEASMIAGAVGVDPDALSIDFDTLSEEYADLILEDDPNGPYRFLGFSSGGVVAVEVARILEARGKQVEFIGLLDTILPSGVQASVTHRLSDFAELAVQSPRKAIDRVLRFGKTTLGIKDAAANDEINWHQAREDALWFASERWCERNPHYRGHVVLFRAKDKDPKVAERISADHGWRRVVGSDLHIVDVPGDHVSLIQHEYGAVLADAIRKETGS